jgi:hypothetical protein
VLGYAAIRGENVLSAISILFLKTNSQFPMPMAMALEFEKFVTSGADDRTLQLRKS